MASQVFEPESKPQGPEEVPPVRLSASWQSYLAAILSVTLLAVAVEALHAPIDDKSRFLVLLIPVAGSAWLGGRGPGWLCTAVSSYIGALLYLPPRDTVVIQTVSDFVSLVLFVTVALVLVEIIESLRRSREALAASELRVRNLNRDLSASLLTTEEALQRQKRFTSDASHELKTPLTAIRARSSLALSSPSEPAELVEHIDAIHRASEIMVEVVQDLLLLAASDEGELPLHRELTSARALVTDALASVDVSGRILRERYESNREIDCDPSAITRVLVNILQNAISHTPKSSRIYVECVEVGEILRIRIEDEGCGIPPAHLTRIFNRFHRVDRSRDRLSGGSGLGLAIAKAIIDAHGGSIQVESTVGLGTSVSIDLPLFFKFESPS